MMKSFFAFLIVAILSCVTVAEAGTKSFSPAPWIKDYNEFREYLETSYANLTWFASPEGNLNLPDLNKRTLSVLKHAKSETEASAAINYFVDAFNDGHLSSLSILAPSPNEIKIKVPTVMRSMSAPVACAALGFTRKKGTAFSLPFEVSSAFELLNSGDSEPFRTGIATLANGKKLGIIRVSYMRQSEFPNECERAWKELTQTQKTGECDANCRDDLNDRAQELLLEDLSKRLHHFSDLGVSAVLLDIGGNSGGNDLGDWIPRVFSAREIHSPKLGIVTDPKSATYYDEELRGFNSALKINKSAAGLAALNSASEEFSRLKELAIHGKKCDMSWVWREQRKWAPLDSKCTNLSFGNSYFSGALDYLKSGTLGPSEVEKKLYWPTIVSPYLGSWTKPVYVAVDNKTGSAAEATAAIFQNNKAAKIIGTKTSGSGCGFMYEGSEFTFSQSRLRFRIPNCVRLKADMTDEVPGIQPNIELVRYEGESDSERALRFLNLVNADLI